MKKASKFAIIFGLFLGHIQLMACSCTFYKKLDFRQLNSYDVIVRGKVLSVIKNEKDWENTVKIQVLRTFKGTEKKDTILFKTGFDGASCGLDFKKGQTWLIYGNNTDISFSYTGLCTRSQKLNLAKDISLIREKRFLMKFKNYNGLIKNKYASGELKNGVPIKTWEYYRNNIIWEINQYSENGILDGISKVFRKNGSLHYETKYIDGLWWKVTYYDENGKIEKEHANY
jgi:hypothetical protein